jgi:undecaprenyl-diphosphatase
MMQRFVEVLLGLVRRFGGREPVLLFSSFLVLVALLGFIKVSAEVIEGDTDAFDKWAVRALRQAEDLSVPVGPPWLQEMGRDATALGGIGSLTFLTLIVAGYLLLAGKPRMMWFMLAASSSGLGISMMLKYLISRPRPDVVPHLSIVHTSSFPSGHSMLSAVVYLTLGALLAASIPSTRLKVYVLFVAILLSAIVGMSRIYLGVHYPTDVLAGWIAGFGWALACWLVAHWLQRHHRLERKGEHAPKSE